MKTNSDGTLDKYKARSVIKWYSLKEGLHFFDMFSHVAKSSNKNSSRNCSEGYGRLCLRPIGRLNPLLYEKLNEEIYMKLPEVYTTDTNIVLTVKRVCTD